MKVSTKLALGYGLLMGLLGALLVYHVSTVEANAAEGRRLSAITSRLLLSATDQRYWLDQMEESATKYRILGDTGYVRKFDDYARRFGEALASFESVSLTAAEEERQARLSATWRAFREATRRPGEEGPSLPSPDGASPEARALPRGAVVVDSSSLDRWFLRLREQTDSLVAASRAAMETRVRAADRRARRAETVAWIGGGAALLLSGAVWFLVVGRLAGGLRSLTAATREVAEGDFDHRLTAEGEDEFAQLARDFNAMTERLGELDRLKRNFVSRISHDLKSPLASMQEANNLLLDGVAGELSEEQRRFLRLSRENGRRLQGMISKLLGLARLEADVESTDFGRHDLRSRTEAAAERMEPSFRRHDVALELRLPGSPVPVVCDAGQVEQLLDNLLENARRHAPGGSRAWLSLDVLRRGTDGVPARRWRELEPAPGMDEAVRLSVADAGPGVEDAEKERIFGRFQHGEGEARSGVGLGLALCREVARAHGGTIWVEDAPAGGAEFVVLLPVRPAVSGGTPAPAEAEDAG